MHHNFSSSATQVSRAILRYSCLNPLLTVACHSSSLAFVVHVGRWPVTQFRYPRQARTLHKSSVAGFYVVACLAVDCLAGSALDSYRADNNSELSCEEFCAGILNDTTDMNEADFEEQWIQRMTTTIAAAAPAAGLKFHIYDHCPFCIRGALD